MHLSGGGLADTITFAGTFAGGSVYGDALGVTTEGTGTAGLADGNDLITLAGAVTAAGSIYGGGGSDSITIADITDTAIATLFDGGNGADSIVLADNNSTGVGSILGGLGADTITVTTSDTNLHIGGGAGQDTIYAEAGSGLTVTGGDGVDTIMFTSAAVADIDAGALGDSVFVGTATTTIAALAASSA